MAFESEKIIERGKVVEIYDEFAKIVILKNENCEACDCLFCNPNSKFEMQIDVINKKNAIVGDNVEIAIGGDTLMSLSTLIYGIPILIIIFSIYFATEYINSQFKELIAIGIAAVITTVYFLTIRVWGARKKKKPSLPSIVKILK